MTPERWERIHVVFQAVVGMSIADRSRYLEETCGPDADLRAEVENLLAYDAEATKEAFLESPQDAGAASSPEDTRPQSGSCLGPYLLQQRLATGGMGSVYKAVRVNDYQQIVAIKLVNQGIQSSDLLKRFHHERQVLAGLNHPHVARLLDGGTTAEGLPYFVMEYVEGLALDEYCEKNQLPLRRRLELFRQVCLAVQHAHEHQIVHRDLKPSNVLVTTDGTPKVTDFGLAKTLSDLPESGSAVTQPGVILGTPGYMAPEQAGGKSGSAGLAVDIYGLGAILYELLTGRPPFRSDTPLKTVYQILHDDVVPPSRLDPGLPRDVQTICLKCLQKDPTRRYGTAAQLAEDVQRYLAGVPILARPVGPLERLYRWSRRNPRVAGLAAALVITTVTALTIVTYLRREAEAQRAEAVAQRQRTQAAILLAWQREKESFDKARADVRTLRRQRSATPKPLATASRDALEATLHYFRDLLAQQPENIDLQRDMAHGYEALGLLHLDAGLMAEARNYWQQALALRQQLATPDATQRTNQAWVLEMLAKTTADEREMQEYNRRALELREQVVRDHPGDVRLLGQLGFSYHNIGYGASIAKRYEEAIGWFVKARDVWQKCTEIFSTEVVYQTEHALTLENLGEACRMQSDIAEVTAPKGTAEQLWEQLLLTWGKVHSLRVQVARSHPNDGANLNSLRELTERLTIMQSELDQPQAAVLVRQQTCEALENVLAQRSRASLHGLLGALVESYDSLAVMLAKGGRTEDAHQARQKAESSRVQLLPASERSSRGP